MKRFPLSVTLLSAVPFVAAGAVVSMGMLDDNRLMIRALLTYATVVLSFLGGIHWGVAVLSYGDNRRIAHWLVAVSVLPSILAWSALLYAPLHLQLLALTLLFTCVWMIDSMLAVRQVIPQWFFEIRSIITPVVVVSLYVAYFGMI